ncbi:MAG TPA: PIN domain-containing protein [Geminicoccaceae bacterium]|nr:PIN domain-containing protein [Geminicoccus sp.]HMU51010.1 PIN domain-containing protein [Geminicoccaceae bacterium]
MIIAFDTNILVYASDGKAGQKHQQASALLAAVGRRAAGFVPMQTIGEFHNVAGRKLGLTQADAREFIRRLLRVFDSDAYGEADVAAASEAVDRHHLSFWDALIWAVCKRAGVDILATEDFQDGRKLGRVRFVDPFRPANAALLGLA